MSHFMSFSGISLFSTKYIHHSINLFISTCFSAKQKFGGPSASFLGSNSKPSNKCIEKFEPKIICALSISILYVWPERPERNFQTLPQPDPIVNLWGYYLIITYFLDRNIILFFFLFAKQIEIPLFDHILRECFICHPLIHYKSTRTSLDVCLIYYQLFLQLYRRTCLTKKKKKKKKTFNVM